ncbi:hypothetical protein ACQP1G_40430 [Nocardia sp. CA-107356]|uniref:hypothetical protein n=1 Tax=Nocardia sp. CA-107356 TaxID=3239972 RepID=UPI003D9174E6
MWEWSRRTAEHASAASWTSWQPVRTEPTVIESEHWAEATESTTAEAGECTTAEELSGMVAPIQYDLVG